MAGNNYSSRKVLWFPTCIFLVLLTVDPVDSVTKLRKISTKHLHANETSCRELHHINKSAICTFVKTTPDCYFENGFFQYFWFPYCIFQIYSFVGLIILAFWLIYLFIALGITAEEFFCPCLQTVARTLRMSDSVAGVTLLALGNGAPDIFSVIAAINSSDKDTAPLAFQELFGAGMFVTTIVAGSIQLRESFQFSRRPYLRDIAFYIAAVIWTFLVMYKKEIETAEAIGFIVLYFIYVAFVIIGQAVNRYMRRKQAVNDTCDLSPSADFSAVEPENEASPLLKHAFTSHSYASVHHDGARDLSRDEGIYRDASLLGRLLGLHTQEWERKGACGKTFDLLKIPIEICLNITTPVVDLSVQGQKWNKWLSTLQCIISPVLCVFLMSYANISIGKGLLLWHLLLIIGSTLSVLVLCLTSSSHSPKYHFVFAFLGFTVSVIWIYMIAQEIVNLLQTFGTAFQLSYAIMGLTLLAWGNSISDFVANLAMARQGAPRMAIAACFGGPLLNMMLGVGIACTVSAVSHHGELRLIRGHTQYIISASFLAISLISSLFILPLFKFRSSKFTGIYLILLYIAYITISVIHESHIGL